MKRFKAISCVIVLSMMVGLISACYTDISKDVTSETTTSTGTQLITTTTEAGPTEEVIPNFNREGYPIVDDPITLTMLSIQPSGMIDDWSKHKFFIRAEELTNIKFNISNVPVEVFNDRKQLGWSSGDLPDLFFKAVVSEKDEVIYGAEGLLIPLNDLIDKYASNIQYMFKERPDVEKAITQPSGKIFALPQAGDKSCHPSWYINVVWLDRLGLNMPTNPDELYNALKMIKEGDPNQNNLPDEIPMVLQNTTRQVRDFMQNFGIAVNASGLQYVDKNTGKVKYGPIQPEFKEGLLWLRKIFADGLLEIVPQARAKEIGHNYQLGFALMDAGWVYAGYEHNMEYEAILPFEVNGRRIHLGGSGIGRGASAITNKNQYPEATIRWLDTWYSFEGARMMRFGNEGEDWEWRDDGTWQMILAEGETTAQKNAYTSMAPGGQLSWWPGNPVLQEWWKKVYSDPEYPCNQAEMQEKLFPYYYEPYPAVFMTEEITKTLADLRGVLNTYVNDMSAKFISGDASIEAEWDSYVAQIHQLGVEELIRIYQDAYDAKN